MKFTRNWLGQYLDTDLDSDRIAAHLSMLGLEVDACTPCYPDLSGVLVARIESVRPHPNADKLVLCEVNAGNGQARQVVCGAPNARAGLTTALATPGTALPGGLVIKPAKIRGEASSGMLCSTTELGISEEQGGIIELAADLVPGTPLVEALGLDDTLIEVDLTPNRPDCASVLGLAREIGGVVGRRIRPPVTEAPELSADGLPFTVEVESSEDCPRYMARLLKDLKVGPSPWWLQQRLLAIGLRPINNVVDVTNFVLMEYGQPLHAFDFGKLSGGRIFVRRARSGEVITTLDHVERKLDAEALLICDARGPVALAGIMGGANSEVDAATVDVLLESACFSPISIRRTASRLKMSTEASYRFERGVDPKGPALALERAVRLLVELCGAKVVSGGIDYCEGLKPQPPIVLRVDRTSKIIGLEFSAERIAELLASIEIPSERIDATSLRVFPPSFRIDLKREIDCIEEVARLAGYDAIPVSLPVVPMSSAPVEPIRALRRRAADVLTALGFFEAINYSFVSPRHADQLGLPIDDPLRNSVHLVNPLAEDQSVLRTSLLPGLLENLRRNLNHQNPDVRLFEIGKVFSARGQEQEQPEERFRLGAVLSGRRHPASPVLHTGAEPVDIFDLKGVLVQLADSLGLSSRFFMQAAGQPLPPWVEPGMALELTVDGKHAGYAAAGRRQTLKAFGIKQPVFFIDLDLSLCDGVSVESHGFVPLPKFPSVRWDLALVVNDTLAAGEMLELITACGEKLVESAEIFDVFSGGNLPKGKKSVAISINYRATDRTLDDAAVGAVHKKIIDRLISRFNGQLREA